MLGVGSGAAARAVGRLLRDQPTRLAVVDAENSAYFPARASDCAHHATGMPSRIEGIGRPRIEPAFDCAAVDLVIPVPDAASVAPCGISVPSVTRRRGACLWGACHLLRRMREDKRVPAPTTSQHPTEPTAELERLAHP